MLLPKAGHLTVVCLGQWRDSNSRGSSYDILSSAVAKSLSLRDVLMFRDIDSLLDVMTFLDVEKTIVRLLRDRVASTADTMNADEVREIATRRQTGHWASPAVPGSPDVPRPALHAVYDALVAAADFFALRNKHRQGFDFDNARRCTGPTRKNCTVSTSFIGHFCEAADVAEAKNWDILKKLRDKWKPAM